MLLQELSSSNRIIINNCDDNILLSFFTGVKIIPHDRVKITHCDDNCCNLQVDKVTPDDEGKWNNETFQV